MPHKHHCLSLADPSEARRERFDPSLASRCPCSSDGEITRLLIRDCPSDGRASAIGSFSFAFFPLLPLLPAHVCSLHFFRGKKISISGRPNHFDHLHPSVQTNSTTSADEN